MNKTVWTAFKAVAFAIIFVIVWSVAFYLFKAYSLNQKIESLMVTMQQEVSKNNYLTNSTYTMYEELLVDIAETMNGNEAGSFVRGFNINYNHPSTFQPMSSGGVNYVTQLDTPGNYGDIAVIELQVTMNAIEWFYDPAEDGAANQVQTDNDALTTLTYTYQVPCLRYISVTD